MNMTSKLESALFTTEYHHLAQEYRLYSPTAAHALVRVLPDSAWTMYF